MYWRRNGMILGPATAHNRPLLLTQGQDNTKDGTIWAIKLFSMPVYCFMSNTTIPTFGRTLQSQPTRQEWDLFHPKQSTGKLPYESYKWLLKHWKNLDGKTWFKIQFAVQYVLRFWLSKYEIVVLPDKTYRSLSSAIIEFLPNHSKENYGASLMGGKCCFSLWPFPPDPLSQGKKKKEKKRGISMLEITPMF